ncbi:MAG: response regulator [Pseudobacteriovorax sp.]|nr:response regulator [Pseudobacteriovorax sp.]
MILVLDDEPDIRDLLKMILEDFKEPIIEAENGSKGLELLDKHSNDIKLVISDMNMPVMDGMAFLSHARENGYYKPFLFITSFADKKMPSKPYALEPLTC